MRNNKAILNSMFKKDKHMETNWYQKLMSSNSENWERISTEDRLHLFLVKCKISEYIQREVDKKAFGLEYHQMSGK